ncbi:suppressor of cytokine signaling 1b [Megalobrama amblycephala]|nr:suppressor of cytokine signaling 1b [Megalobrama amblycephala]XP_048053735.1 suppressor of cytokine signaling 1b [Megalobrama amblycephala]XP_048053736.1 suppressor of cytokine signaling 1b [Megalobrama amblycephala]
MSLAQELMFLEFGAHFKGQIASSENSSLDSSAVQCKAAEPFIYALGPWRNGMSGPRFRMVQHNDSDHTVAPQGPAPKPAEPPKPCSEPPTHFHPFRDQQECDLITQAVNYLNHSGFYWGPMEADEAHARLAELPLGTFLIRDSMQANVFFTLSYRAPEGPTSVRVLLKGGGFSLAGSKHTFACLFHLIGYYIASPKKSLSMPYRGDAPQSLQELARRAVMQSYGKDSIHQLPVSKKLKEFLLLYPFSI